MSNNVYFGKCISSGSGAQKKIVYMEEIPEQFNEGDLLAVFFTNKNTHETPSIVFRIGSTQQEVSVADDEGIAIKSYDIEVEKEGLWGAGETVLFCFVQRPDNGILYLELIGKLQASNTDYGIVKLNGISENQTLENWLKADEAEDDYKAAINTATVKALIKALFAIQDEDDDEEEQPISFGLQWIRNPALTEELFPLGDLSLGNSGISVSIGIPKNLITQKLPEYTGELTNNGSDGTNKNGEPYITRYIPNDLLFEPSDMIILEEESRTYLPSNGIALSDANLSRTKEGEQGEVITIPENLLPYHIRFDTDKLVLGYDQGETFHKVLIRPALKVEGPVTTTQTIDADAEINGTRIYGGSSKPTWGEDTYTNATIVSEGDIYENNGLLKERYSGKLKVFAMTSDGQTIPSKTYKRYRLRWDKVSGRSGWQPIGVIGYNANSMDTKNSNDVTWANVWELFVIGPNTHNNVSGVNNDVQVAITNLNTSKSIEVNIIVYVLCEKVL